MRCSNHVEADVRLVEDRKDGVPGGRRAARSGAAQPQPGGDQIRVAVHAGVPLGEVESRGRDHYGVGARGVARRDGTHGGVLRHEGERHRQGKGVPVHVGAHRGERERRATHLDQSTAAGQEGGDARVQVRGDEGGDVDPAQRELAALVGIGRRLVALGVLTDDHEAVLPQVAGDPPVRAGWNFRSLTVTSAARWPVGHNAPSTTTRT